MKKFIISFILFVSLTASAYAENKTLLLKGINYYKDGNFLETLQVMQDVIKQEPSNAIAYYYMGMAYVQIGDKQSAEEAYNTVMFLEPDSQLAIYAEMGKKKLAVDPTAVNNTEAGSENKLLNNYKSNGNSDDVDGSIKQRKLQNLIDRVNNNDKLDPSEFKEFKDFSPDKSLNAKPSAEEIAKAYETLSKAGVNPYSGMMNPDMMNMSMLTGGMTGQSGQNSMNMLPFLMMMQNQQGENKVNPEYIQTMISNMMMPDMMNLYDNNKD
ncbi:MAG TPA: hypothetical protein P5556_08365 [Candidatus Gastranaerophilales bacterium]|nr:hypothetical protein [Candidatus Gastranaerophilales bacterium]